jgi:diacylglycerol kinase (ATP)
MRRINLTKQYTAIIIHSPHSGRSAQLPEALKLLKQADIAIAEVLPITQLSESPIQGSLRKELGVNLVIAAGGDGLIGGVITHIAESNLPLGILPLGTANDLARSINIPQDLQQAVETIRQGKTTEIDIGVTKSAKQVSNQESGRGMPKRTLAHPQSYGCFAHALTVGLNVQFARLATNVATRQRYGKLTYPMAAFKAWLSHEPLEFDVRIEGLSLPPQTNSKAPEKQEEPTIVEESVAFHGQALQVAVINAPTFGGKWNRALPNASINDHLLDIIIVEAIELQGLIADFGKLFNTETALGTSGQAGYTQQSLLEAAYLTGIPGIHHIQAHSVTISTNNDPEDVTLDGEIRGQTPIHIQMANTPLQVIVP